MEMLSKMPNDFHERVYREQVSKLSGPPALNAKGLSAPLNIFLFQVRKEAGLFLHCLRKAVQKQSARK